MSKAKVTVVFRDNADGFSYSVEGGSCPYVPKNLAKNLDRLLKQAFQAGAAAEFTTELAVSGWGPVRWSVVVDKEILRDLLVEAAAAAAAAA